MSLRCGGFQQKPSCFWTQTSLSLCPLIWLMEEAAVQPSHLQFAPHGYPPRCLHLLLVRALQTVPRAFAPGQQGHSSL